VKLFKIYNKLFPYINTGDLSSILFHTMFSFSCLFKSVLGLLYRYLFLTHTESIKEEYRLRCICNSHFRGWQFYVLKRLLDCSVYREQCIETDLLSSPTQNTFFPPSNVRQLITHSPILIKFVTSTETTSPSSMSHICSQ
jgi:hypothetical protein